MKQCKVCLPTKGSVRANARRWQSPKFEKDTRTKTKRALCWDPIKIKKQMHRVMNIHSSCEYCQWFRTRLSRTIWMAEVWGIWKRRSGESLLTQNAQTRDCVQYTIPSAALRKIWIDRETKREYGVPGCSRYASLFVVNLHRTLSPTWLLFHGHVRFKRFREFYVTEGTQLTAILKKTVSKIT